MHHGDKASTEKRLVIDEWQLTGEDAFAFVNHHSSITILSLLCVLRVSVVQPSLQYPLSQFGSMFIAAVSLTYTSVFRI